MRNDLWDCVGIRSAEREGNGIVGFRRGWPTGMLCCVARNAARRCVVVGVLVVVMLAGFVWESRTSLRRQMPRSRRSDGFSRVL